MHQPRCNELSERNRGTKMDINQINQIISEALGSSNSFIQSMAQQAQQIQADHAAGKTSDAEYKDLLNDLVEQQAIGVAAEHLKLLDNLENALNGLIQLKSVV